MSFIAGLTLFAAPPIVFAEDGFEKPPTFKASEILAEVPETLSGEYFQVREEVPNDGYWDFYTIDTPFGVFQAHGWLDLRQTVQEINAIATLREMSQSRVFAEAVIEQGLEPVDFAAQIVQHPAQTVNKIPDGIVNMFQRYARRAKKVLDVAGKVARGDSAAAQKDPRLTEACRSGQEPYPGACDEEGYADDIGRLTRRYFDVNDAAREFHEQLGTDPYSSNQVLQEAISRVSWIGGAGKFGMKKVNPWEGAKAIDITSRVYKYAWGQEPFELRKSLNNTLAENGISEEERLYFLNNPYLTPTKQAFIVLALENLDGVEGREHVLHWAGDSRNEDEAFYTTAVVALVDWYHQQHTALRFLPNALMPVLELQNGEAVALHPIDHLSWTEDVATLLQAFAANTAMPGEGKRTLWLLNRASERARNEIEALGFNLVEDGYKDVLASGETLELDRAESRAN